MDVLAQLAREGQAAGIHLVLAGDQTTATLFKVLENVALRMALQLGDVSDYKEIFDDYPDYLFLPQGVAGRGLYGEKGQSPLECQMAVPRGGAPDADQEASLERLVGKMHHAWVSGGRELPMAIGVLPTRLSLCDLLPPCSADRWSNQARSGPLRVPIGLDDLTLEPMCVDLPADGPHFLVTGPPQGGKTTVLVTWLLVLAETFSKEMVQFVLLDTFKQSLSVLKNLPHVRHYATSEEEQRGVLEDLRTVLDARRVERQTGARPAIVVVVDDSEFLTSSSVKDALKQHALQDHPFGFHVILAGASAEMSQWDEFRKQVLANRSGLFVGSNDLIQDASVFNLTLPHGQTKGALPPGRGYLVRRGQVRLVQVATPGDRDAVEQCVQRIVAAEEARRT